MKFFLVLLSLVKLTIGESYVSVQLPYSNPASVTYVNGKASTDLVAGPEQHLGHRQISVSTEHPKIHEPNQQPTFQRYVQSFGVSPTAQTIVQSPTFGYSHPIAVTPGTLSRSAAIVQPTAIPIVQRNHLIQATPTAFIPNVAVPYAQHVRVAQPVPIVHQPVPLVQHFPTVEDVPVPQVYEHHGVVQNTVNVAQPAIKTRKFEVRRPAIQKQFYDIEERVIVRPAGSVLLELDHPLSKIQKSELITPVGAQPVQFGVEVPSSQQIHGHHQILTDGSSSQQHLHQPNLEQQQQDQHHQQQQQQQQQHQEQQQQQQQQHQEQQQLQQQQHQEQQQLQQQQEQQQQEQQQQEQQQQEQQQQEQQQQAHNQQHGLTTDIIYADQQDQHQSSSTPFPPQSISTTPAHFVQSTPSPAHAEDDTVVVDVRNSQQSAQQISLNGRLPEGKTYQSFPQQSSFENQQFAASRDSHLNLGYQSGNSPNFGIAQNAGFRNDHLASSAGDFGNQHLASSRTSNSFSHNTGFGNEQLAGARTPTTESTSFGNSHLPGSVGVTQGFGNQHFTRTSNTFGQSTGFESQRPAVARTSAFGNEYLARAGSDGVNQNTGFGQEHYNSQFQMPSPNTQQSMQPHGSLQRSGEVPHMLALGEPDFRYPPYVETRSNGSPPENNVHEQQNQAPAAYSTQEQQNQAPAAYSTQEQQSQGPTAYSTQEQQNQAPAAYSTQEQENQAPSTYSAQEQQQPIRGDIQFNQNEHSSKPASRLHTRTQLTSQESTENQKQYLNLILGRGGVTELGFGPTNSPLIETKSPSGGYLRSRILSATPAPRNAPPTDERVQTRRIVVSHPIETVQEIEVQEPVTKFHQVTVNQPTVFKTAGIGLKRVQSSGAIIQPVGLSYQHLH